ncbi:MAG: hypothetical protein ABI175_22860 [Polyangiales bacterium]
MRSLALVVVLVACRSYSVPVVPQPTLAAGATIELKHSVVQVKTGTHDVCDGESRCRTEDVTRDETRTQILAGTQPLSYGQLREVDPADGGAYAKNIAEFRDRSGQCRTARKLKIAGVATIVVGGVIALLQNVSTAVRVGGLSIAGGGVLLVLWGRSKGKDCDNVYKFYKDNQLDLAETTTIPDRKKELEEIAARFNAGRKK